MSPQARTFSLAGAATPLARVDSSAGIKCLREADTPTAWLPLDALAQHVDAWRALAERALEPNVFYEPAFARAAAEAFDDGAGAVLVWAAREPARLIGFFPARIERRRYGFGPAVLVGWTHPYAPLGVPLVDRAHAAEAMAGWLDHVAQSDELPKLLLLPYLTEGPVASALQAALAAREGSGVAFGRHARALLAPGTAREKYLDRALPVKKRRELRRQRRRLEEDGAIELITTTAADDIPVALEDLLTLEVRGWKGAAGTAATQNPAVRRFMQRAVSDLAAHRQAQVVRLTLGAKPIAAAIILQSGPAAWFWKIAYDEAFAPRSPGVQLTLDVTQAQLADTSLIHTDSCAMPDHPMIDHIWRERLTVCDLLISPNAKGARTLALASLLENSRRGAIASAKWMRTRLRGR
jgi:CelD/BcsL family acetyltransferase involved in cellulose biosynthesis